MIPDIILRAVIAGIVVAIVAYIAEWFAAKAGLGFPRTIIWLVAFLVWVLWVFGGSFTI